MGGGYSGGYSKWIFTLGVTGYSLLRFEHANSWGGCNTEKSGMELKNGAIGGEV